jgi:hypothetical protein
MAQSSAVRRLWTSLNRRHMNWREGDFPASVRHYYEYVFDLLIKLLLISDKSQRNRAVRRYNLTTVQLKYSLVNRLATVFKTTSLASILLWPTPLNSLPVAY